VPDPGTRGPARDRGLDARGVQRLRFVEHVSVADEHHVPVGDHPERQAHRPVHGLRGRQARPGAAADGRAFAVRQFHLHRLRGDEIVGHSAVRDDLGMLTQIGAFPPDHGCWRARWPGGSPAGRRGRAGTRSPARKAAAAEAEREPAGQKRG
jgi:hypothetical protein